MTDQNSELADLGWNIFFSLQLDTSDLNTLVPAKVVAVQRSNLRVIGPCLDLAIPPFHWPSNDDERQATVGDWLLLDAQTLQAQRLLIRKSLFKRRAAGTTRKLQLIAANVDTLFIVSSCNQDFNIARLERYLVVATEAGVVPVIILTKADLIDNPEQFAKAARKLQPGLLVETVNALDPESIACLTPWCAQGQTVALLGSSGVGKSTLTNTLIRKCVAATQHIREDDDKGRHTTSARAFHRIPDGGWLLDTPGMRELQLTDVADGLRDTFADITAVAKTCRFSDCKHETEPDCAVRLAIEQGTLDAQRLKRWRKLLAEEAYNTQSLAQRHARDRVFGKMYKRAKQDKQKGRLE